MMRYVVVTTLAAVMLLGVIGGAVTHAQQNAKWADVLWVYDGKEWIPYVDGMTIPTGMPKFRGNTGDISSVQVALNGKQVGMNELSVGYTFIKGQKTLLQNGTYTLTVRDCGMIVEPPNVGECSLDTADLDDHPILFTGTITIKDPTQKLGMVPPPPSPPPPSPPPPSPPELPPTQEDPIPSENSVLKDLITALQKQIKALEDRIADLEAAMFGAAGNETTTIITRTEPPILPPLEPSTSPQQGDYYIKIVSDMSSSFDIGDRIHFEAKLPPCPAPIYALDGSIADYGGFTSIHTRHDDSFQLMIGRQYPDNCNTPLTFNSFVKTQGNILVPNNHSEISGYFEVMPSMIAGENYLDVTVFRNHLDTMQNYYSETFTLSRAN